MAPLAVMLSDLEGHLLFETFLTPVSRELFHVLTTICLHMNRKAHVACNFSCLIETKGLLRITRSHMHCKCGNILETVQGRDVVTTDH